MYIATIKGMGFEVTESRNTDHEAVMAALSRNITFRDADPSSLFVTVYRVYANDKHCTFAGTLSRYNMMIS